MREEPRVLEEVERLCWLDIRLISEYPETITLEPIAISEEELAKLAAERRGERRENNFTDALEMAKETYEQMRQYALKLKCCKASPAEDGNVQWNKVEAFLRIRYGNMIKGMDDETLERKRRTLTDYTNRYPVPKRLGRP